MKKTWSDILSECTAQELDVLLDDTYEFDSLDPDSVKRIQNRVYKKTHLKRFSIKTIIMIHMKKILIACCLFLCMILITHFATLTEAKEYENAIEFFHQYDLSIDGLTRNEIKNVYRDITAKTFSFSKTAQVIEKRIQVNGHEIFLETPTCDDIENLWNYLNHVEQYESVHSNKSITYEYSSVDKFSNQYGFLIFDHSQLNQIKDNQLQWSLTITDFMIENICEIETGLYAYGTSIDYHHNQSFSAWISKIDENGNILWMSQLDHGFENEQIIKVIENPDKSIAVFSYGNFSTFSFSLYDENGNLLNSSKTDLQETRIDTIVRCNDGYIVQLTDFQTNSSRIEKLDSFGNFTFSYSYFDNDCFYHIIDLTEINGNIYLSADVIPKSIHSSESQDAISSYIQDLYNNDIDEISPSEFTPNIKNNVTAMLLICDLDHGTPQEYYSVKGSWAGKLELSDDHNLIWHVENILSAQLAPRNISSHSYRGQSILYQYIFDQKGLLIQQRKTNQIIDFMR